MIEKIKRYAIENENKEEAVVKRLLKMPVPLAYYIALYAHRNQIRENGEPYINHPISIFNNYYLFADLKEGNDLYVDVALMEDCGLPYLGVRELCFLHDVVEDTEITIEDIENIYTTQGLGDHFDKYIKDALIAITHDKNTAYSAYIEKVLSNRTASLVKMLDLYDNMNPATLSKYTEKEKGRMGLYMSIMIKILDKYDFTNRMGEYILKR